MTCGCTTIDRHAVAVAGAARSVDTDCRIYKFNQGRDYDVLQAIFEGLTIIDDNGFIRRPLCTK